MTKELKIGIFAIVILVVSFFLINYLRGEDLFDREIDVTSEFSDLQGLVASAPVYIKGYKVGKVSEVSYDPQKESFNVVCSILKEFRIPDDSKMTIYSVDIMGGKGIRIDLGESSAYISDGDVLAPSFEAGLMDALSSSIGPLMDKLNKTLDSLSVTVSSVNELFSDSNQAAVQNTLIHLENTLENVSSLSSAINGKSSEIEMIADNLLCLSDKLDSLAGGAQSAVDEAASFVRTLNESDIEGVVTAFKEVLESLNDPDGTVGKLFVDDSVYDSVEKLLSDIDVLVNKIKENPKKYLRISVF